jgi:hypothetical protein
VLPATIVPVEGTDTRFGGELVKLPSTTSVGDVSDFPVEDWSVMIRVTVLPTLNTPEPDEPNRGASTVTVEEADG